MEKLEIAGNASKFHIPNVHFCYFYLNPISMTLIWMSPTCWRSSCHCYFLLTTLPLTLCIFLLFLINFCIVGGLILAFNYFVLFSSKPFNLMNWYAPFSLLYSLWDSFGPFFSLPMTIGCFFSFKSKFGIMLSRVCLIVVIDFPF